MIGFKAAPHCAPRSTASTSRSGETRTFCRSRRPCSRSRCRCRWPWP
nr:MAG TPA: hypothetical protein [Inoviridae sp.]